MFKRLTVVVGGLAAFMTAAPPVFAETRGGTLRVTHRDNPPSAPRVRRGKDTFRGMLEHCAAAGVKATVEHGVSGEERAAATVTCEFPGGRKVVANAIFELRNGRIVCERDVLSGDPR